MKTTPELLADLEARGLIQDHTDGLADRLAEAPLTLYYGCDPTADSLHIGNLIGLLVLRRFQAAGHRPIALAGGATGMIGDPSGRSEERNLLDEATLAENVSAINGQIERILGEAGDWSLVDNLSWTRDLTLLDFLRDVGKHVTVNQMVAKESVKARMASEVGISYTEFTYMLLQARDYRWLHDHEGCELQIGGSDQWGNVVAGVELVRRTRGRGVHGLSWPLLTAPDGTKLGKTTGARTWLDPRRTSPYAFFQHWMHTDDRQVAEFLAKFTLLPLEEVASLADRHAEAPHRRTGQQRLAREVTGLVHGAEAAEAADAASRILFGEGLDDVTEGALEVVTAEVPTVVIPRSELEQGIDPVDLLRRCRLAGSNGEARRIIAQGGAYVNQQKVAGEAVVGTIDLLFGRYLLVRRGQRKYVVAVTTRG